MITPPRGALTALRMLQEAGFEAYFVGGCVRDRLLNRPVNDWDIATNAQPSVSLELFERTIPTGLQHGTVTAVLADEAVEITTYRVDVSYSDGRRPDEIRFTPALREDLARRDFTINAMAWDPRRDVIIDPFDGQKDLRAGLIRAVGRPLDRFTEDGLRPFRAVRFASTLGLDIEAETWAAIPLALETARKVAIERIRVEWLKALDGRRAAWAMDALWRLGLFDVFLPELATLSEARRARIFDSCATPLPSIPRLATFLHAERAASAEEIARRLRFPNEVIQGVAAVIAAWGFDPAAPRRDAEARAALAALTPTIYGHLRSARRALAPQPDLDAFDAFDARLTALDAWRGPLTTKDLPIHGGDVIQRLALRPSPLIGRVLERALWRAWADPQAATREALLAALPALLEEAQ
ncbi:[cytidine(C)-cytidine(C)-adenosine (A)]-adding enzyme [Myxococcota bacterium]|nr:[cytidine(C)-cytidine(C)-adenosine (A)]-adding enzyme [Myxococcota bacterium]